MSIARPRLRILALIAEHDFQPNAFATAISSQKSRNIGLIIPHETDYIFLNPFFVEVLRGISTAIDEHRYSLLVSYAHAQDHLGAFKQKKVDGFIVLSPGALHHGLIGSLTPRAYPSFPRLASIKRKACPMSMWTTWPAASWRWSI